MMKWIALIIAIGIVAAMWYMAVAFAGTSIPNCVLVTVTSGTLTNGTPVAYTVEEPPQLLTPGTYGNIYQCLSVQRPGQICTWQSATCVYSNQ